MIPVGLNAVTGILETELLLAFGAVVALVAIWALLGWLRRATFTPFVIYRILLGAALLYWTYAGQGY